MRFPLTHQKIEELEEKSVAARDRANLRVLLIDDDELVLTAMKDLFEILGHRATPTSRGEDALEKLLEGEEFDLVVLDMNMPGIGGGATFKHIREINPTLPVILATGRADEHAQTMVDGGKFIYLLPKPFYMNDFKRLVETIFEVK